MTNLTRLPKLIATKFVDFILYRNKAPIDPKTGLRRDSGLQIILYLIIIGAVTVLVFMPWFYK